jgi:hypothetical protein
MIRALGLWTLGCVLLFLALAAGIGCGGAQVKPSERVDEGMWCFAAVVGGQDLVTCSPGAELCEAARAGAAASEDVEAVSEVCLPVRVQLDHRDAGPPAAAP